MISFNPAVELSYLSPEQQQEMIKAMDDTQNAPSVSQAKRIKELAQKGQFTSDAVVAIMGEEKKGELDTVTIKNDILRKYFPRSYTPRQMEEKIIQLLDAWQKKRQRTPGKSHVGIYLGNGKMVSAGDPIKYADIHSSYWQKYLSGFGRLSK